jgi:hypothetical protein
MIAKDSGSVTYAMPPISGAGERSKPAWLESIDVYFM